MKDAAFLLRALLDRAEQAERERDALNAMAAVCEWQARHGYHPLTCGNDDCRAENPDAVLVPLIRDGICVLACPQCDYVQTHIPDVVLCSKKQEAHP